MSGIGFERSYDNSQWERYCEEQERKLDAEWKYACDRKEPFIRNFYILKGEKGLILTKEVVENTEMKMQTEMSHRYAINTAYHDILGLDFYSERYERSMDILCNTKSKEYPRVYEEYPNGLSDIYYYVLGISKRDSSEHIRALGEEYKRLKSEKAQHTVYEIPFDKEHTEELVDLYSNVLGIYCMDKHSLRNHINSLEQMVWEENHTYCLCCGKEIKGFSKSKYNYCGWCLKQKAQESKEKEMNYKYEYKEVKYKTLKELAEAMEISLGTLKKYLNGQRTMPYELYSEFYYLKEADYDKIKVR